MCSVGISPSPGGHLPSAPTRGRGTVRPRGGREQEVGRVMSDTEEFLASVLPPLKAAETAFHNGDVRPRIAMWSRSDPVTLFGALLPRTDGVRSDPPSSGWRPSSRTAIRTSWRSSHRAPAATSRTSLGTSAQQPRSAGQRRRPTLCALRPSSVARAVSGRPYTVMRTRCRIAIQRGASSRDSIEAVDEHGVTVVDPSPP